MTYLKWRKRKIYNQEYFTQQDSCWIWQRNQKLHRQEKVKRIQHHRTSFPTNAKGISLGRKFSSVQFSSVVQSCPTLCDPMNHSTPGLPIHHQLLEFIQTHAHQVRDAIQLSHPVVPFSSCPQSLPASDFFPVSQLFAWGGQSTEVSALASFLPVNTQDWSPLQWTGGSPCSPRDSQESSPTPHFKSINSSVLSFL